MSPSAWALWTTVVAGFFGLLTASTTLFFGQRFDREKRAEENKRWQADRKAEESRWIADRETAERQRYLDRAGEKKLDKLEELHAALVDTLFAFRLPESGETATERAAAYDRHIRNQQASLLRASRIASAYLDGEGESIVGGALVGFIEATNWTLARLSAYQDEIAEEGKPSQFNFQTLTEKERARIDASVPPATRYLKRLLNPE